MKIKFLTIVAAFALFSCDAAEEAKNTVVDETETVIENTTEVITETTDSLNTVMDSTVADVKDTAEVIVNDIPFLVDSIRIALNRLGLSPHLMLNSPLKMVRDKKQNITKLASSIDTKIKATSEETVFFIEIDRQSGQQELDTIKNELLDVVKDITLTVNDWQPMLSQLKNTITDVTKGKSPGGKQAKDDTIEFLTWIAANNFTLMGYRAYDVKAVKGDIKLEADIESSLGLMKN